MSIMDKLFGSKDPTTQRHKEHDKAIKKVAREEERRQELAHRKNECRIMLRQSEEFFNQAMHREVKNARQAQSLGIDFTLNKNHFSDAARGVECVRRARWYMDSIGSDEGLQGALRLLNQALKTMERMDGGMQMVSGGSLRRRVDRLYEQENMKEDDTVLDPSKEFVYKFENGLFENMVAGMSYDEAKKASNQDLNVGGAPVGGAAVNFSDIFADKGGGVDEAERMRRKAVLDSRKDEM